MQKHLLYINLFTITSALALAACADEMDSAVTPDVPEVEVGEKTPIVLSSASSSEVGSFPLTRSAFVDGNGKVTAFEKNTRLHFLFVSENADDSSDKKYSETYGVAKGSGKSVSQLDPDPSSWADTEKESAIDFSSGKGVMRYWDDAHARKSKLSVYGFTNVFVSNPTGAPWYPALDRVSNTDAGKGTETQSFPATWKVYNDAVGTMIGATAGKWTVGVYNGQSDASNYLIQSKTSILSKDDIAFSNNLSVTSSLKFDESSKKFTSGVAEFHRAMSMITINICAGEGFDASKSTEFQFTSGTNIAMKGWNKKGYLNIKTGKWTDIEIGSWTKIDNTNDDREGTNKGKPYNDNSTYYYTLLAFVIPGNDLNATVDATNNPADALSFTIDGNKYDISKKQLYDALRAGMSSQSYSESDIFEKNGSDVYSCTKAGINYEFTLTIGKTKINQISAKIVDWKTVVADVNPDNAHPLEVMMETTTATLAPIASYLYKSAVNSATVAGNGKGYSNSDRFLLEANTAVQNTGWYWPNNNTYYHFRTIAPKVDLTVVGDENDNYITMFGNYYNSELALVPAEDYVWGAPLKEEHGESPENHNISYNWEKGYTDHLYPAIGATNSNIHITQFHMMTDLVFNLKTTTGADAVTLTDNVIVALKSYAKTANLMVGTGLIAGYDDIQSTNITPHSTPTEDFAKTFNWRVIPQALSRGESATVGLCITTTDGNVYDIPDLSTLPVKVNSTSMTIPKWEPGKKYVYNLTLKKTGIEKITATVVNWETVAADYDNVQIR